MRSKQPDEDYLQTLSEDIARLARRVDQLDNASRPTAPVYDPADFPQDAVEGQYAVSINALWYYFQNGAWHTPGGGTVPRFVYGGIYNDNEDPLVEGSGDWSVEITGSVYVVTFDVAYSTAPVVLTTPNSNNAPGTGVDQGYFAPVTARSASGFTVKTYMHDNTADDGGFDFLAIGPA